VVAGAGLASVNHAAIEVRGLVKRFGKTTAVSGIEFRVRQGELFGFLGPNGAGKTTTINLLTGLARPDVGTIRIADIECTRKIVCKVPTCVGHGRLRRSVGIT
jgi:ABC-2 type transport system ATP-binding protein